MIIFVRNLPFSITGKRLLEIFGRYGMIRQIRLGNSNITRGTAYIVYEDIFDAINACEYLSGFNIQGRYIILLLHHKGSNSSDKKCYSKNVEVKTSYLANKI